MTEPAVLTVEEAARVLRIGRSAAYDAVRRGELPAVRIGRTLRIPRHRLEQMLGHESDEAAGANQRPRETNFQPPEQRTNP